MRAKARLSLAIAVLATALSPWTAQATTVAPDLSITKIISNSTPTVGDLVTFTLTVTNVGGVDAFGLVATDAKPSGFTLLQVTSTAGSFSNCLIVTTCTFLRDSLASNATWTMTLVGVVNTAGIFTNTATVSFSGTDLNPSDNTATVQYVVSEPATVPEPGSLALLGLGLLGLRFSRRRNA